MSGQPTVLGVETATRAGSVCIIRGRELLGLVVGDPEVSHSSTLLGGIQLVLRRSGLTLADVTLYGVARGPGSFTGLRIGIATVKALASSFHRPCVGISSLKAVALAGGPSETSVALLPAGRGELFVQSFSVSPDGKVVELDEAAHARPLEVLQRYGKHPTIRWCGEGAHLNRAMIQEWAQRNASCSLDIAEVAATGAPQEAWTLAPQDTGLSRHIAALALSQSENGNVGTPYSLRAWYVRPADAKIGNPE